MDTLASLVSGLGPLTELEAVGWTLRIAKRVESLHRLGVAHGGISAEAIQCAGPTPRTAGALADVRQSPTVAAYHSPEREGPSGVSTGDDAWAIAVTLYYLLTGSLPFPGGTTAEVRMRLASPPPPLAVFGVDDDELQRLVDRFFHRSLAHRVARVAAMRELLESWSADPALRGLPALDEAPGSGASSDDDDEDDDNAATQMRDVGDIQALIAQARSLNEKASVLPPAPSPGQSTGQSSHAARPTADPRRGTLLGVGSPMQRPVTSGGARPLPVIPPPMSPALPASPPRSLPLPAAPRQPQLTMASMTARPGPPMPPAPPAPPPLVSAAPSVRFEDDEDDGGGATMMLDAGAVDVSAAIEEALKRNAASMAPVVRVEPPANSVDGLLGASIVQSNALAPPAAPAPLATAEPRGLKIALVVGIVLLVIVVAAVAVLYFRMKGLR